MQRRADGCGENTIALPDLIAISALKKTVDVGLVAAKELSVKLSEKYGVPVLPINCLELTETEIKEIMTQPVSYTHLHRKGLPDDSPA